MSTFRQITSENTRVLEIDKRDRDRHLNIIIKLL